MHAPLSSQEIDEIWRQLDREATEAKFSHQARMELSRLYRQWDTETKKAARRQFGQWLHSDDPKKRFAALSMIEEFSVTEAEDELYEFKRKREGIEGPEASFEVRRANEILANLLAGTSPKQIVVNLCTALQCELGRISKLRSVDNRMARKADLDELHKPYAFVFYCYFKWFDRQAEYGDPAREAQYYAWTLISLIATSLFIAIENLMAMAGIFPFFIYSDVVWLPELVKYGWTFPLFLIWNFRVFLAKSQGLRYVEKFEQLSHRRRSVGFALVGIFSVGIFFGSLWLTLLAP